MDNVDDIYPLTPSQAGILYHTLRSDDPALYFEQVRADLEGDLDVAAFSFAAVVARRASGSEQTSRDESDDGEESVLEPV